MHALIVGYGSIGQRHQRLLTSLGLEVGVVSRRPLVIDHAYASIAAAMKEASPHLVVIASQTAEHYAHLSQLEAVGFDGVALVEKPLFDQMPPVPLTHQFPIFVGFHLRFHPLVQRLRKALEGQKILSAHMYVGQHLSTWRDRPVKEQYSAYKAQGGGVIRDLSHELDMLGYLFGDIQTAHCIAGRFSQVTVDSEDIAAWVIGCAACPVVSLQMNYVDHVPRREYLVVTEEKTYRIDFMAAVFEEQGIVEQVTFSQDDAYLAMHRALLAGEYEQLCSFQEGLDLVKVTTLSR